MDIPTPPGSDEARSQQAPIRVSRDGIHVMKVASAFGESAIAVDLTVRSDRDDQCEVQVTDALPEALLDNHVEFHPKYDPDHWTRESDRVVYRAPIGPGVVRRTVYGVSVDDLTQLASFSTEPSVEVIDGSGDAENERRGDLQNAAAGSEFSYDRSDGAANDDVPAGGSSPPDPVTATKPETTGDSVVAAFVSEFQHRELTPQEQATFRAALGLDADREALRSLTDAVTAIEDELKERREQDLPSDGAAMELESIEARLEEISTELESVVETLSADLDDLRGTIEREVRWRSRLRRSLARGSDLE